MPTEFDGDRTIASVPREIDPDDCATLVIRHVRTNEPTPEALEDRIETIDRIIDGLEK